MTFFSRKLWIGGKKKKLISHPSYQCALITHFWRLPNTYYGWKTNTPFSCFFFMLAMFLVVSGKSEIHADVETNFLSNIARWHSRPQRMFAPIRFSSFKKNVGVVRWHTIMKCEILNFQRKCTIPFQVYCCDYLNISIFPASVMYLNISQSKQTLIYTWSRLKILMIPNQKLKNKWIFI
jgi:hypothetical protein